MAASGFGHLEIDERRSLFRLREARVPVAETASCLGRHRSTINRELHRSRFRAPDTYRDSRRNISDYYPITAQDQALAAFRREVRHSRQPRGRRMPPAQVATRDSDNADVATPQPRPGAAGQPRPAPNGCS